MDEISGNLAVIAVIFVLTTPVLLFIVLSYLQRRDAMRTLREAIGKGAALNEETLRLLGAPSRERDIRRGGLFLALSAALMVVALTREEPGRLADWIGVAAFPAFLGLAYLAFAFFGRK